MTSETDEHADKYSDPRVAISRRGVLIGVGVVLFGVCGSALSIWARRTHLERTTEFWGPEVITALQLAEEVELIVPADEEGASPQTVRLSGMPGLGHMRHVFLDDRSYDWDSIQPQSAGKRPASDKTTTIRFTDPTANRFSETRIVIDLDSGWVCLQGAENEVQLNERFQTAVPVFLERIMNYEPLRADQRD